MNDYMKIQNEKNIAFHNWLTEVVSHIEGASVEPMSENHARECGTILLDDTASIWCDLDHNNRVRFSMSYTIERYKTLYDYRPSPYNKDNPPAPSDITCAYSRSPESVAGDIKRKLLPEIKVYWPLVLENYQTYINAGDKALSNAESVAAVLNTSVDSDQVKHHQENPGKRTDFNVRVPMNDYYGDVRVNSKTAEIHLRSVPIDKALAILKALND